MLPVWWTCKGLSHSKMLFRNTASQKKMLSSVNPQVVVVFWLGKGKKKLLRWWRVISSVVGVHCSVCAYTFRTCALWRLHGRPPVFSLMMISSAVLGVNRSFGIMCQNFGLSKEISREENCLQILQSWGMTTQYSSSVQVEKAEALKRTGSFFLISSSLGSLKHMV